MTPRPGLVADAVRAMDAAGIRADDITVRTPSLDDVFLALTGRTNLPSGATHSMSALTDLAPLSLEPDTAAVRRTARTRLSGAASSLGWALSDIGVLTWRALARIASTPEQVLNVTVQPVVLVLLFSYVFDGAIKLPGGGNYRDYLIAGVIAVNMGAAAQGAAISMAVDQSTGLVDRLRSLPMSRVAFIAGRTLADLVTTVLAAAVAAGTGLAVGWRVHGTPAGIAGAAGLALLFGYCAAWAGACVGMRRPRPGGGPGGRADGDRSAVAHFERVHRDDGDARLAPGGRGLEPGQCPGGRVPAAARQP